MGFSRFGANASMVTHDTKNDCCHQYSSDNVNFRGWLRRRAADGEGTGQGISRNPIKLHIVFFCLDPTLHLTMQLFHLLQREKTLKRTFLHPATVPSKKVANLVRRLLSGMS